MGSILREARDRVVSLTTDARSSVIACHVSAAVLFSPPNRTQEWGGRMCVFPRLAPESSSTLREGRRVGVRLLLK